MLYNPWRDVNLAIDIYQLQAYAVSGNSSICAGGTTNITLSGSQLGGGFNYLYDLYKDNVLVSGQTKTGTGGPLVWTVSTASNATYTVKALNGLNLCTLDMTGSANVFVGPITTIGSLTNACVNGTVTVPVTVKSFEDVGAISLTLSYDPSRLTFLNGTTNSAVAMANLGISNPLPGMIRLSGFIEGLELPVTLSDDETLMNLSFTYHGGLANIDFDDATDPDNCNYGSGAPLYVPFCDYPTSTYYINGTITEDNNDPVAVCQNITIQLDATGNALITPAQINNGSTDDCGIAGLALSRTAFTCTDISTNPNLVTLTVTDNSGNTSTCNAYVTVEDITPPTAVCQNITVQLDVTGHASITASQINNGSSDACGIASMSVSPDAFDCSDINLPPVATDLIISEYVEGSSNNKSIEIFNGTGSIVNLATGNYRLVTFSNGSITAGLTINLTGTIAP
ncbi:MAG: hypothetical protein IPN08_10645 [Bacteroidales bacterium]|nr:hypothetical protein [Bacteroidales bacterium]